MRATNERLTILSKAEQSALYDLPDFDNAQRLEYLTLTEEERKLAFSCSHLPARIYCILQIGYFKAKQLFFNFTWEEIDHDDLNFILQQFFPDQSLFGNPSITKHEHYSQCHAIASHFSYRLWSRKFEELLRQQINQIILRDINPQFIVMELLNYLREQKIIRPRYTSLQIIIRDTLNVERKRLKKLINKRLNREEKFILNKLLLEEDSLSQLAALKQDAKEFKARMMIAERKKLMVIKPIYLIAKTLLPKLKLSKQNIHYYGSLINYYSIHDLRERLKIEHLSLFVMLYLAALPTIE